MVDKLNLTLLADDSKNPLQPELQAKHGLSIYIEAKVRREKIIVLMDTGPSPEIILHNADAMDVDLKKVQVILLSHGHYDHTGGVIGALTRVREPIPVLAHPKTFDPKFAYRPHIRHIGSPVSRSEIQAAGGIVLTATNPVNIGPGVMSSGEIERSMAFEDIKGFWRVNEERFVRDLMSDDQALIINLGGQGLVIVAGCAHAGIINTIKHAQQVTGVSRVHAVLGGFNLRNASTDRVAATIQELRKIDPSIMGPCHCTGSKAIRRFKDTFQDRCTPLHVDALVEINST
ncbi:MAG: MBL fold metallo-hydrolase [Candidatus Bathyarchaeota archaeon]|nr:MBL fold metallo-hydrolase [Candidatus Bathyarchaeota archaeon]